MAAAELLTVENEADSVAVLVEPWGAAGTGSPDEATIRPKQSRGSNCSVLVNGNGVRTRRWEPEPSNKKLNQFKASLRKRKQGDTIYFGAGGFFTEKCFARLVGFFGIVRTAHDRVCNSTPVALQDFP